MEAEGVEFRCGVHVGIDITAKELIESYDAVCLAIGAEVPRNLNVEGRDLPGVHFALEFLQQQNRVNAGTEVAEGNRISARGKNVLVIGGGDTGSDCVGTAHRQGALSVTQIEIMPKPPENENPATPWPYWPVVLKTTSSHQEGCDRRWLLDTTRFIAGTDGKVAKAEVEEVLWEKDPSGGRPKLVHTGHKHTIEAELVLLAMGFTGPVAEGLLDQSGVEIDARGNVRADDATRATSVAKVFAAGDVGTGASLVVRAIASGRAAASGINDFLS